jgi:TrpR-related protein YerC/YecD
MAADDENNKESELFDAFLLLENTDEVKRFLRDLCSPQEIKALQERWKVCQLLEQNNLSYRDISKITKASLTTIGRVARFLKEEHYAGYKLVLEKLRSREKI